MLTQITVIIACWAKDRFEVKYVDIYARICACVRACVSSRRVNSFGKFVPACKVARGLGDDTHCGSVPAIVAR